MGTNSDFGYFSNAAKTGDELVNLASSQRTAHILTGDATGGGHLFPGAPGKTAFPQGWSGDQVMHHVSDIATDPALKWVPQTGSGGWFTKAGKPARFNEPTRQPMALAVPTHLLFEVHAASRLRTSLSRIPKARGCHGYSLDSPFVAADYAFLIRL